MTSPTLSVVAGVLLSTVPMAAAGGAPSCHYRLDAEQAVRVDGDGGSLLLQRSPAAIRLQACRTTVAAVLSALSDYGISYRSSIALNEARNGTYAGSLAQVITRVLDGYNYVIKHDSSRLEIIIYGNKGKQAVAAPIVTQVSQNSERPPHAVARTR
jgi:hypothetical protein